MTSFLVTKIVTTTTTIEVEAADEDAALDLALLPENDDNWTFDESEVTDVDLMPDPEACTCSPLTGSWSEADRARFPHAASCPQYV